MSKKSFTIIILTVTLIAAGIGTYLVLKSVSSDNSSYEPTPMTEDRIKAAERLRAGSAPTKAQATAQEKAAEALKSTSTIETMSPQQKQVLINAAEALKAK